MSFPDLTVDAVRNHLPKSAQTVMGHLHMIQKRKKNELMNDTINSDFDANIRHELPLNRKYKVVVFILKVGELNGTISSDLLGRFLLNSAQDNTYILVMYCYTNNAILATSIQLRLVVCIEKRYYELYKKLLLSGIIPVLKKRILKQAKTSAKLSMIKISCTK